MRIKIFDKDHVANDGRGIYLGVEGTKMYTDYPGPFTMGTASNLEVIDGEGFVDFKFLDAFDHYSDLLESKDLTYETKCLVKLTSLFEKDDYWIVHKIRMTLIPRKEMLPSGPRTDAPPTEGDRRTRER